MTMLPKKVLLREEGPREGFQALSRVVPTSDKLRLIRALSATGVQSIETTSFVRADRVPQHADAEAVALGLSVDSAVRYRALYLNAEGLRRAFACSPPLKPEGAAMLAASESFLRRNNNRTLAQAIDDVVTLSGLFAERGLAFERLMVSTCFGDEYEGRKSATTVLDIVDDVFGRLREVGRTLPEEITFADTTGWGNPTAVHDLVEGCRRRFPGTEIGLHLHDTRGTGMANVYAGLLAGVARFDCSVGGLGGCPFAQGAAGNVPTEDVAFLCQELGITTGVDLEKYIEAAKLAETIAGITLPGKLLRGGLLNIHTGT